VGDVSCTLQINQKKKKTNTYIQYATTTEVSTYEQ